MKNITLIAAMIATGDLASGKQKLSITECLEFAGSLCSSGGEDPDEEISIVVRADTRDGAFNIWTKSSDAI